MNMAFPPSKLGDIYNYRVAAYLKTNGIPELGPYYDLRLSSIRADPPLIPDSATLFQVPVSLDVIASTAYWEIYMECKHILKPRPVSFTNSGWMEAMAEFLSLDKMRDLQYKDIKYFFITNSDTTDLSQKVRELRISSDEQLSDFGRRIKRTARRKWKKPSMPDIPTQMIRRCLDDVRIFTFEDSKLDAFADNPEFSNAYKDLMRGIGERLPDLPRNLPSSVRILVTYRGLTDSFVTLRWAGYSISIPKRLVQWARANAKSSVGKMVEFNFNELPSGDRLTIRNPSEFSTEQVTAALTASINSAVLELSKNQENVFVVSPMNRKVYLVNSAWLLDAATSFRNSGYRFHLGKMQKELRMPLGGLVLQLAIQEAFKLRKSLNLDPSFFLY
jgi:hypothetical protein